MTDHLPPAVLHIGGENLSEANVSRVVRVIADLRGRASVLHLALHGLGGSARAGDALFSLLQACPIPTVGHVVGRISSTMVSVLLGAETRYATPTATISVHGTCWNPRPAAEAGRLLRWWDLQEALDAVAREDERAVAQLTSRTKVTEAEARELMRYIQTPPLAWHLERQVIHDIRPFRIPDNAIVIAVEADARPGPLAAVGAAA